MSQPRALRPSSALTRTHTRPMFSDAPITGPYAPSCGSRAADGAARGVIIGVAWTAAFGEDVAMVVASDKAPAPAAAPASLAARCRSATLLAARNSASFAAFLGVFSGASCSAEQLRGRDDFLNKLVGGLAAGFVAALPTGSPRQVALSAAYTGGISGFVFFLFAPARNFDDD